MKNINKIKIILLTTFILSNTFLFANNKNLNLNTKEYFKIYNLLSIEEKNKISYEKFLVQLLEEKALIQEINDFSYKNKDEIINKYLKIKNYKNKDEIINNTNSFDYDKLITILNNKSNKENLQIKLFQEELKKAKTINEKKILIKKIKNYFDIANYHEKIFLYSFLGNVLKNISIDEEIFDDVVKLKPDINNILNIEIINAYYSIFYKIDSFNFINMLQKDIAKSKDLFIKTILMSRVNLINNYYKKELFEMKNKIENINYKNYFISKKEFENLIKIYK